MSPIFFLDCMHVRLTQQVCTIEQEVTAITERHLLSDQPLKSFDLRAECLFSVSNALRLADAV